MALGTDMKSLVEDIQVSRDEREKALGDIRKDTHHILRDARGMLKDFGTEDKERAHETKEKAKEVKTFLASSEESRKHDFGATMKTVKTSLADVKKDSRHARHAGKTIIKDAKALLANIAKDNKEEAIELRENLDKAEQHRKSDFKSMMGDIHEDLKDVRRDVSKVTKDARDMVSRYHNSRMTARRHWASLADGRKKSKVKKGKVEE